MRGRTGLAGWVLLAGAAVAATLALDRALPPDLSRLADYLNPDVKKLQAKGITSVRARVTNLAELTPGISYQAICSAVTDAFFNYYG